MNAQELKTFLLQDSGDFDKFDISATLKLSDKELNREIQQIRKRQKWFFISRIIFVVFTMAVIFNMQGKFVPIFQDPYSLIYAIIILALNNGSAKDKKKEYIYNLLLKLDKQDKGSIAA